MKRREFIGLLGGAAVSWPLLVRAQQPAMPVIGFLDSRSSDAMGSRLGGFRQGLKELGFAEGENVAVAYRWAEEHFGEPVIKIAMAQTFERRVMHDGEPVHRRRCLERGGRGAGGRAIRARPTP